MLIRVLLCLGLVVLSSAKKDAKECEVCIKVLDKVVANMQQAGTSMSNEEDTKTAIRAFCKKTKIGREERFCYYIGGMDESATGLLQAVTGPLGRHLPTSKVCAQLKKKDSQICDLQYEEVIDLKTVDLDAQKVKTLKKILSEQFGDACKGCVEKQDFINKIRQHQKEEL